jgi:DNA-binding LacI/PurR family transcriptional regulator
MNDIRGHLYGFPIIWLPELTLADQVADILRKEISGGRWAVGERLPSLSGLVEQTGLSRDVILRAMERLNEDGYIRQEKRKGSFLKSRTPKGARSLGVIGVAVPKSSDATLPGLTTHTEVFGRWRLDTLLMNAGENNYTVEILPISDEKEWAQLDQITGPFGERVAGIISFRPLPHRCEFKLGPDRIPIVFLGLYESESLPCVTGDSLDAIYWMTRRLLDKGHRSIALYCHPEIGEKHNRDLLNVHKHVMAEAGFSANLESAEDSLHIGDGGHSALKQFIDKHSQSTAILSFSGRMAGHLCDSAEMAGLSVPQDMSIVSLGHDRSRSLKVISGMMYDWDEICRTCIEILKKQMKTRECSLSRVQFRAFMLEQVAEKTDTLGPPRGVGRRGRRAEYISELKE